MKSEMVTLVDIQNLINLRRSVIGGDLVLPDDHDKDKDILQAIHDYLATTSSGITVNPQIPMIHGVASWNQTKGTTRSNLFTLSSWGVTKLPCAIILTVEFLPIISGKNYVVLGLFNADHSKLYGEISKNVYGTTSSDEEIAVFAVDENGLDAYFGVDSGNAGNCGFGIGLQGWIG